MRIFWKEHTTLFKRNIHAVVPVFNDDILWPSWFYVAVSSLYIVMYSALQSVLGLLLYDLFQDGLKT